MSKGKKTSSFEITCSVFCGSLLIDTRLRGRSDFGAAKARHLKPLLTDQKGDVFER